MTRLFLLSGLRPITTGVNIQAIRILMDPMTDSNSVFYCLKLLKKKVDNLSMMGAYVLANNKENLNMDGCLWYFGGISSSIKLYTLDILIKIYFCFWRITKWTICISVASKGSIL